MKKLTLAILLSLTLLTPNASSAATTSTVSPKIGLFSFSVLAEGKNAAEAQTMSEQLTNTVVSFLKDEGVTEKDIKTENYSLNQKYDNTQALSNAQQKLVGYEVSQTIKVQVRDLSKAGELTSGVKSRGAVNVSNLQFISDTQSTPLSLQALMSLLQSLQAQLNAMKATPTITVQAVSPTQVRYAFANLPSNTSVYLVSSMSPYKAYKMSTETGSAESVVRSIPNDILDLNVSTQYRIEARDQYGATKATSEYFQAGGYPEDIPKCTMTASDYDVKGGESVTLKWTSSGAQSVYKSVGFSSDPQMSSLGKNSSLTVRPTISGSLVYGIVFGATSGSQSICEVFIHVAGATQSGSIDTASLSTNSIHPTLTGTAINASTVKVFLTDTVDEKGEGRKNWVSAPLSVRDGKWSYTVTPSLTYYNHMYVVELNAYDKGQYFKLADGKLYVK